MIYDEQICELLKIEVPEIKNDGYSLNSTDCISGIKLLTMHTAKLIEKGSVEGVQKCFLLAEQFMVNGSRLVKSVLTAQFLIRIYPMLKPEKVQNYPFQTLLTGHLLSQYRYSINMDKW